MTHETNEIAFDSILNPLAVYGLPHDSKRCFDRRNLEDVQPRIHERLLKGSVASAVDTNYKHENPQAARFVYLDYDCVLLRTVIYYPI